ncbi:MAG: isochorismatase family protein [Candidatus Phlomobacter fragariae]
MYLVTDYCAKFTVIDAVQLGYQVTVIRDGCRGVNLNPEGSHRITINGISWRQINNIF